jgi:KUP system potassium uptake protein
MSVWHYGTVKRYDFELESKVSMAWILGLGPSLGLVRVPGIGLLYTELVNGVPHIFSHLITYLPAMHSIVVFVCLKYLPVNTVPQEERFLVKRIGPKDFHMFRCVARYGYKDLHKKDDNFEKMLLDKLSAFIRYESLMDSISDSEDYSLAEEYQQATTLDTENANLMSVGIVSTESSQNSIVSERSPQQPGRHVRFSVPDTGTADNTGAVDDEIQFLNNCRDSAVVHIMGNTIVRATRDSNMIKKIVLDYIYAFLRRICRENSVILNVPHESLLNVGQVFYV